MPIEKHYSIQDIVSQGIQETCVRAAISSGELATTRFSARGRHRIPESTLLAWLKSRHRAEEQPTDVNARPRGRRQALKPVAPVAPRRDRESVLSLCPAGFHPRF